MFSVDQSFCNDINRISKPLQSRFRRLHLAANTQEQFLDVAVKVLPKLKETTARMIGHKYGTMEAKMFAIS